MKIFLVLALAFAGQACKDKQVLEDDSENQGEFSEVGSSNEDDWLEPDRYYDYEKNFKTTFALDGDVLPIPVGGTEHYFRLDNIKITCLESNKVTENAGFLEVTVKEKDESNPSEVVNEVKRTFPIQCFGQVSMIVSSLDPENIYSFEVKQLDAAKQAIKVGISTDVKAIEQQIEEESETVSDTVIYSLDFT